MTDQNTTVSDATRNEWERRGAEHMAQHQPPKPKAWWKKPIFILPAACLLLGLGLGASNRPAPERIEVPGPERVVTKTENVEVPVTPEVCLTALDLAEQGFTYAAESMGYMSAALTAASDLDIDAINKASADLKVVTPKMEALAPKANAAKSECRATAK